MRSGLTFVLLAALVFALVVLVLVRPNETVVCGLTGETLVERAAQIPNDWKSIPILDAPEIDHVGITYERDEASCWMGGGSACAHLDVEYYDFRVGAPNHEGKPAQRLPFRCTDNGLGYGYCLQPAVRRRPFENGFLYVVTVARGSTWPQMPRDDKPIAAFVRLPPGSEFPPAPAEPWTLWRAIRGFFALMFLAAAIDARLRSRAPARASKPITAYRDRPIEEPESPVFRRRERLAWAYACASFVLALAAAFLEP